MESFRDALHRLTQNFVSELLETVRAAALEQLAEDKRETRPKPVRILRTNHVAAEAVAAPVVVRKFEIPVGQPRRRRRRAPGAAPIRKPAPPPPTPKVVKFEVVPHPEQRNRRIVLTRLDNA
jgi:hypothetical protein